MERMKVEIDSEELKRLKSREEKYLAYMDMLSYRGEDETYVDALCGRVAELEEENKKLKEEIKRLEFDVDAWHQLKLLLEGEIEGLGGENEKLKETIKDHQLYEEKLEHRIIEFEELLHGE